MSNKIKKITVVTLVAIIAIIFLGSAAGKVSGSEQMVKMAAGFGFSTVSFKVLGNNRNFSGSVIHFPQDRSFWYGITGCLHGWWNCHTPAARPTDYGSCDYRVPDLRHRSGSFSGTDRKVV